MFPKPLRAENKTWTPKLDAAWVRTLKPIRRWNQRREHRVVDMEVHGMEHLQNAIDSECGLLIAPNHPGSADPFVLLHAADRVDRPFYFMAAWQLFADSGPIRRHVLQRHGVFSVDREGADLTAFRQSVDILKTSENPLVIFPEGEVYHVNDRVTPFREGPAAIALSAAKKAKRPVCILPAAMKYYYVNDPTPALEAIMDELEARMYWPSRRNLPLAERIYRFAEGPLALKELQYLGRANSGPLPQRVANLRERILHRHETTFEIRAVGSTPERIKALRQRVLLRLDEIADDSPEGRACLDALDDLFFCVQLFSYPGDYVSESPTIERIAETIDKFAEDILGRRRAAVCADRKVVLSFDAPLPVHPGDRKIAGSRLTREMQTRVQHLLDAMPASQFGGATTSQPQRHRPLQVA